MIPHPSPPFNENVQISLCLYTIYLISQRKETILFEDQRKFTQEEHRLYEPTIRSYCRI